jgi:HPt (histidine-containing phosphotransfer) domain-containing protein
MPGAPALDPAVIASLRRAQQEYGNPEFIARLVALFQANAPGRLASIREAVAARDSGTISRTAHTLKSNCGMLGATRLADLVGRLETCGDAGEYEQAAALLDEAAAEMAQVLGELTLLAGSGSGSSTQ